VQASFCQVRNIQAETKIREVIVFTEGAQVERIANVTIPAGRSEFVFSGISPQLEKQSIQVKTATGVTVLSVNHQVNFFREQEIREDIRALEEKMQETEDKMELEKSLVQVYKQEEAMLQKNQEIGGNNGIKTPDLKEALDFQRQKLTEVLQKQFESQKKVKQLEKEVYKIRQQLAEINQEIAEPINIGIGINTGTVVAGYVGTKQRVELTILGDTVNVASRLQSQARPNRILVGPATVAAIVGHFQKQRIGAVNVKGRTKPIQVHEVVRSSIKPEK
jgi:hypothetical protein